MDAIEKIKMLFNVNSFQNGCLVAFSKWGSPPTECWLSISQWERLVEGLSKGDTNSFSMISRRIPK